MFSPQLVVPPDPLYPAVSLEELKEYLGVTTNDNDRVIAALARAAEKYLDAWDGILYGRCLAVQTWSQAYDGFPCAESWAYRNSRATQSVLRLQLFPVIEIVSVEYYDSDGVLRSVPPSDYYVLSDALGSYVASVTPWPASSTYSRPDAVFVEAKFGYEEVPEPIKTAICMKVARMYSLSRLGSVSSTSGLVRSETVDGIGSQTFGGGSDIIQIMRQNTETEEYLLGPYMRGGIA